MKNTLRKEAKKLINAENLNGDTSGIWGDASHISGWAIADLTGDVSNISGYVSMVWGNVGKELMGDVSGISGDVSGLWGRATGLKGNLDMREITDEERKNGIDIKILNRRIIMKKSPKRTLRWVEEDHR